MSVKFNTWPEYKGLKIDGFKFVSDTRETTNLENLIQVLGSSNFEAYEQYK
jgi:hypothetical protein